MSRMHHNSEWSQRRRGSLQVTRSETQRSRQDLPVRARCVGDRSNILINPSGVGCLVVWLSGGALFRLPAIEALGGGRQKRCTCT